jgi:hypothetical protein
MSFSLGGTSLCFQPAGSPCTLLILGKTVQCRTLQRFHSPVTLKVVRNEEYRAFLGMGGLARRRSRRFDTTEGMDSALKVIELIPRNQEN